MSPKNKKCITLLNLWNILQDKPQGDKLFFIFERNLKKMLYDKTNIEKP